MKLSAYSPVLITALFVVPAMMLTSCDDRVSIETNASPDGDVVIESVESEDADFRLVRVLGGLENAWAVAWLPDDRMIITERPGRMNLFDGETVTELSGLPDIHSRSQGGLLDVALHPDYEDNGWIYFTYSIADNGNTGTALGRARLDGEQLVDVEELYVEEPAKNPGRHYGSRIAFPGDGTVLFTIGDRGERTPSQDLQDPAGSTIRLNYDGSVPDDNPFAGSDEALPVIYSYGHRNAQGMVIHPETGAIWQHEHGPQGGDELNIIQAGGNYGWPDATYGDEYGSGQPIGIEPHEDPDIVNPLVHWSPTSIAPSGMAFYYGNNFPGWHGDVFIGALAQQHVRRVVVDGEEVDRQEELLSGEPGRIRDIRQGPDGNLYLLTDHSDGGLYRIEPLD